MNRVEKVKDGYDVHFNGRGIPLIWRNSAEGLLTELEAGREFLESYISYADSDENSKADPKPLKTEATRENQ